MFACLPGMRSGSGSETSAAGGHHTVHLESGDGERLFGLLEPAVVAMLQTQPAAAHCAQVCAPSARVLQLSRMC